MADRKKTPDLLGEILGEIPTAPPAAVETPKAEPASKPAKRQAVKPAKRQATKPAAPPPEEAPTGEKVKSTFYLSPGALDALEAGWLQLRRLAGKEERGKVSKSLIVELALQGALEDLKANDRESQLAIKLASQHDSKPA